MVDARAFLIAALRALDLTAELPAFSEAYSGFFKAIATAPDNLLLAEIANLIRGGDSVVAGSTACLTSDALQACKKCISELEAIVKADKQREPVRAHAATQAHIDSPWTTVNHRQ